MTENIFIGIFRLKGHQGMGKTCACFKFKEKVWLWDTLVQIGPYSKLLIEQYRLDPRANS